MKAASFKIILFGLSFLIISCNLGRFDAADEEQVITLAWSPYSNTIAIGGTFGMEIHHLDEPSSFQLTTGDYVQSIEWLNNQNILIFNGIDGVTLLNVENKDVDLIIEGSGMDRFSLSPGNQLLAVSKWGNGNINLYRVDDSRAEAHLQSVIYTQYEMIYGLATNDDYLAISVFGEVEIYHIPDQNLIMHLQYGTRDLFQMEWHEEKNLLAILNKEQEVIEIWDMEQQQIIYRSQGSCCIAWQDDLLATVDPTSEEIVVIDINLDQKTHLQQLSGFIEDLAWNKEGSLIGAIGYSKHYEMQFWVVQTNNGTIIQTTQIK